MATITAGNELYLYQLLSREVGTGRQVMLARVEEILLANDVWPSDLDCADVRELLEHLSGFVRLTVFKKGRVYATVLPNPEWDAILERAQSEATERPAEKNGASGAKSWKRKRAKRDPRPTKPRPKGRAKPKDEPEPMPADKPAPDSSDEPTVEAVAEPEPAPAPRSVPALEPSISFTVTYDPYQDDVPLHDTVPATQEPQPTRHAEPIVEPSPTSQLRLPQNFAAEVLVRNQELSELYRVLPIDVDPMALLDEDWRVARSTEAFTQDDGALGFLLHYGEEDNIPLAATIRRTAASASGKRWVLTSITAPEDVGLEGLPTSGDAAARELAQFAQLGALSRLASELSGLMDKTSWQPTPAELQRYLSYTFCRIQHEGKFVTAASGLHGAFNTGLLTNDAQGILMCFDAQPGDIPWRFSKFCTPSEAGLAEAATPLPASYVTQVEELVIPAGTRIEPGKALLRTYGEGLRKQMDAAVRRVSSDYRLGTPAYDPVTNEVRLLVPLRLGDGEWHALVLCHTSRGFVAHAILLRERAAEVARVVSRDLPRWLEA